MYRYVHLLYDIYYIYVERMLTNTKSVPPINPRLPPLMISQTYPYTHRHRHTHTYEYKNLKYFMHTFHVSCM